ncbi:MAG TPA: sigma-70 family RNA polymerase sigma factor [Oscillatoriaceae cyanobacterium]
MTTREVDLADLLHKAREGSDAACLETFVRHYLPLIRPIARHFAMGQPDLVDDLTQVGAIGLLRAIERFDPSLGKPFEAYAARFIAGEMRHYLRDHVPLVRPPRELVELRARVREVQAMLMNTTGENASAEAIAAHAGLPLSKVEDVLQLEENFHTTSLDQELEAAEGTFRYQLVDNRYKSFQLRTEDQLALSMALGKLRAASREVIEFAFYDDLTQTEIAKKLGISQMQVSRRLKSALGELWKALNTKLF